MSRQFLTCAGTASALPSLYSDAQTVMNMCWGTGI